MPALQHKSQPRWKYYLSCHFLAVSSWLIMKDGYKKIDKKYRLDYWIGIGAANFFSSFIYTVWIFNF